MSIDFTPEERATILLQAKSGSAAYAVAFYFCILVPPLVSGLYGILGGGIGYVVVGFLGTAFFCLLLLSAAFRGGSTFTAICRKIVASWTDSPAPAPAPSPPVAVDAPQ